MLKNNLNHTCILYAPDATAEIMGAPNSPNIHGSVRFYQTDKGVLVSAEIYGLPTSYSKCSNNIFAFHIHDGNSCTGTATAPFADTKSHYNPENCPHPSHAGDLPPLFSNGGYAWTKVLTDRFTVTDIIGKTILIHSSSDDFTSQPAGNSGIKIACGVIQTART
ncbi:MAG: superoxide dismutase family protein [Lachnospiraceae bacterium]|nr:superoxide dismutase family protein [Lachnospiraceae bacterium]